MNNLSWFLYLAEVIPNIGIVLTLMGVALTLGATFYWIVCSAQRDIYGEGPPFYLIRIIVTLSAVYVFAALVPSKETIYLIAGSEAGEAVVTSPEGQEILDDIHQVIKYQLGQLKGGTE